jgi:predicted transposase YbfD/YdcC
VNDITLSGEGDEGIVFEVHSLIEQLEHVTDERKARGKRYRLSVLLVMVLLAKLSGEHKPAGIAQWLRLRQCQLVQALGCKHRRVPSLNTIRRVLSQEGVRQELQGVLRRFLHQEYGGQQSVLVAIDGKTLRGTIPKGKTQGVHLLAAYLPAEGVTLLQLPVANKENEIVAAPRLLAALDLKGRVVCGDAMFTQRELSVQVLFQGADYIWLLKDNQPTLKSDVCQFFEPPRQAPGWRAPVLPETVSKTTKLGHGRLEQRTLRLIPDEHHYLDWPGLKQVLQLERRVIQQTTGAVSTETVYGITSLPPDKVTARQLLDWIQGYWGIENGLHYRRDVSLQEDALRMTNSALAEVMATLNSFIVGLVQKLGFNNLAAAQRQFEANLTFALANFS